MDPPSAKKYGYWTNEAVPADPGAWFDSAQYHEGSWWDDWASWIAGFGDGEVPARAPGSGDLLEILEDAPGSYVRVRIN